ncbi:Dihydroorotate dehydrogenase B (NAD(+)), catalytic subunit [Caloramator mitchellensis]|uniref:Dihydroorotate dehydrogenase n=1 Tax=Caloramator mitchellensis TaxID=908809 RepID=A0A0R3JTA0_CALMK|nr:dihydroorotate dehydrogenase [Caloramator mitchellensis]KRQ86234.1 Dihydroorotate dehydrogenase B (NAD(+)), catalytic subunit [Caloramator mitchellensis]
MLEVNLWGKSFKNPVIAASGTFGFGREYDEFYDVSILGGIATKGLTLNKREGNMGVRCFETSFGMLNSVGLQNPGIDYFIENELPFMKKLNTVILANLGGGSIEEYVSGAKKLDNCDVDIIELNISCPNVKEGGMNFGIKSKVAKEVVKSVREVTNKPLVVKLSPNAEDIVEMAMECVDAGADGLSLVNTFKGMAVDIKKRKPVFNNIFAGLSGPCIKPIALRMVYEVSRAVNVPIIGLGGITNYKDAIEFIMAGASLVQVGTANFINPLACKEIIVGMEEFLREQKIDSINDIIGII